MANVIAIVLFRLTPAAFVSVTRRVRWSARVLITALCIAAAGVDLTRGGRTVVCVFVGALYFAVLTVSLLRIVPRLLRENTATRGAILIGLFFAFVGVPATVLRPIALGAALVGWEATLSFYSYAAEMTQDKLSRRECLFFVLVDPTLVYAERSEPTEGPQGSGVAVARLAYGFALEAAVAGLLVPWLSGHSRQGSLDVVSLGLIRFVAFYLPASALAHIQIAAMALLGYRSPERYDYPFLASNPLDFWRRWNTYVGRWLRRYVFLPLACSSGLGKLRSVTALGATFLVIGLLHDAFLYFNRLELGFPSTFSFFTVALCTLGWIGLSRAARIAGVPTRVVHFTDQATAIALIVLGAAYWG